MTDMKYEKRTKRIAVSFDEETLNILEYLAEMDRRPVVEFIYLAMRERVFGLKEKLPALGHDGQQHR